jgi:hypothetical protein
MHCSIDQKDITAWTAVLQSDEQMCNGCATIQLELWKKYQQCLVVTTLNGNVLYDGRWQQEGGLGAVLVTFDHSGAVTWQSEKVALPKRITHRRHACFIKRLQKLLKISECQWKQLLQIHDIESTIAAILTQKDSKTVILGVLGTLWNKSVFQHAFSDAEEIAIQVGEHVLFETKASKHHHAKSEKRLVINVCTVALKSHKLCHKFKVNWTFVKPTGPRCLCGCGLYSSELRNPVQSQCRPITLSPMTQLDNFGMVKSMEEYIMMQANQVQYFMPHENKVIYADFFDATSEIRILESYHEAFLYAIKRQKVNGREARNRYYGKLLKTLGNVTATTKMKRGTLYVAFRRLLSASHRFTWTFYNIKSDPTALDAMLAAFADVVSTVVATRDDKRKMIRIKEGKRKDSFYSVTYKNVYLFDMANLVESEISGKSTGILSLYQQIREELMLDAPLPLPENSASQLMVACRDVFHHRLTWLFENYKVEWLSGGAPTLQGISFNAITNAAFKGDPSAIGLEMLGRGYADLLKFHNRGGLMLSTMPQLSFGDPLGPVSETASSLIELDACLAYAATLSNKPTATSYVRGYHLAHDSDQATLISHDSKKQTHFEFLHTFYTLAQFIAQSSTIKILVCYHKFSPHGQFRVSSAPLDLLIVYLKRNKKGEWQSLPSYAIYNYNHQFSHSCPEGCPELESYIGHKTSQELLDATGAIDKQHTAFFSALFASRRVSYETIYNCHRKEKDFVCPFTGHRAKTLHQLFKTTPNEWLRGLVEHYPTDKVLSMEKLNKLIRNPNVFCYVVATGSVASECASFGNQMGYVLTRRNGHLTGSHCTFEPTLFDGATLSFLMDKRGFSIERVFHVLIFSTSSVYCPYFENICNARVKQANSGHSATSSLLKYMACGFVGQTQSYSNSAKFITLRNASKPIRLYSSVSTYNYQMLSSSSDSKWLRVTREAPVRKRKGIAQIIGINTVLQFKLQLLKSVLFIEEVARPTAYRLLQISTDSILLALSGNSLDASVHPASRDYYEENKHLYFSDPPKPGYLKVQRAHHETNWRVTLSGARSKKITTVDADEKGRRVLSDYPQDISIYRHVCESYYGKDDVKLWWTLPFGNVCE